MTGVLLHRYLDVFDAHHLTIGLSDGAAAIGVRVALLSGAAWDE